METSQQRLRRRRQELRNSARRLFLTEKGELNADARRLMLHFATFTRRKEPVLQVSPISGTVDPLATAVAIGRREVFEAIERLLHLSPKAVYETEEEDT